ncbi:hypothetical protein LDENG_00280990 [Lucifuga dentata]|nr:hypothetical protein LDENG_00280990 [Lucifuga dentata]
MFWSFDEAESDGEAAESDSDASWSLESPSDPGSEDDSDSDSERIPLLKKSQLDSSSLTSAVISSSKLPEAAGLTAHARRNIEDAVTAFLCLFDDGLLKHIRDCTVAEAHRVKEDSSWDMTVDELKAFIALVYIRGTQGGKGMDLASFWSTDWGYAFFKKTMSRNRFQDIM